MEAEKALAILRESTRSIISDEAVVSIAYSGGLDSSIVAAIARGFATVRCYTCFVEGSHDARTVQGRARSESLDLIVIDLSWEKIPQIVREATEVLGSANPTEVAYTIPILAALNESQERLMLVGSGADELFGGYAKYGSAADPSRMMAEDLDKMFRESELLRKAARRRGKLVGFPFVSDELVAFSKALPLEMKISHSERKLLLREVARLLELPSHDLPKKAAQYSSGVLKEMRRQADSNDESLAEWVRNLAGDLSRSS